MPSESSRSTSARQLARVGRRQPGAEDDEDVGPGAGQRVGGVVDDHVPDDPTEPRPQPATSVPSGEREQLGSSTVSPMRPASAVRSAAGDSARDSVDRADFDGTETVR